MNSGKVIKGYYYLAPVWFILEVLVWPGLRAGPIVGNSMGGAALFYAIEAAIGGAFWMGLPSAEALAFLQNIVQLISIFRYILFTPMDIALNIDTNVAWAASASDAYAKAIPGAIFSGFQIVHALRKGLGYGKRLSIN